MIREIKAIVRHERVPDVFRALHEIPDLQPAPDTGCGIWLDAAAIDRLHLSKVGRVDQT